jgi:hypothetical protein
LLNRFSSNVSLNPQIHLPTDCSGEMVLYDESAASCEIVISTSIDAIEVDEKLISAGATDTRPRRR